MNIRDAKNHELTDPLDEEQREMGTPLHAGLHDTDPQADDLLSLDDESVDEESVEQYMSSLLERYGVSSSGDETGDRHSSPSSSGGSASGLTTSGLATRALSKGGTDAAGQAKAGQPSQPPNPPKKRTPPPEATTDLSALRELANMSARRHIARHSHHTQFATAMNTLLIACGSIIAAFALMRFSPFGELATFGMAAVPIALAGWWSCSYFRLVSAMTGAPTPAKQSVPESDD